MIRAVLLTLLTPTFIGGLIGLPLADAQEAAPAIPTRQLAWADRWMWMGYVTDPSGDVATTGDPTSDVVEAADLGVSHPWWYLGEDLVGRRSDHITMELGNGTDAPLPPSVTSIDAHLVLDYVNPAGQSSTTTIDAGIGTNVRHERTDVGVAFESSTEPDPSDCRVRTTAPHWERSDIRVLVAPMLEVSTGCFEDVRTVGISLSATVTADDGTATVSDAFPPMTAGPFDVTAARTSRASYRPGDHAPHRSLTGVVSRYDPADHVVVVRAQLERTYARNDGRRQVIAVAESYNDDPDQAGVSSARRTSVAARVDLRGSREPTSTGDCAGVVASRHGRTVTVRVPVRCYRNRFLVAQSIGVATAPATGRPGHFVMYPADPIRVR